MNVRKTITYLSEASERSSEDQNFADLCKAIDLNIQKMFHIRCKNSNRLRPLLDCFTSEVSKLAVLSNAPCLRFHDMQL